MMCFFRELQAAAVTALPGRDEGSGERCVCSQKCGKVKP